MYVLDWNTVLLLPLLALPQFYGGILLSFTRIKLGFMYAVLLHLLVNLIAFSPVIFLYANRI